MTYLDDDPVVVQLRASLDRAAAAAPESLDRPFRAPAPAPAPAPRRLRGRRILVGAIALAALVPIAFFVVLGENRSMTLTTTTPQAIASAGLATWPGDPDSGYARLQARNEGVLALINGCVVLDTGSVDGPLTLVLPAEATTFDGTAITIRGQSFPLGTTVWTGGGASGDIPSTWSVPTTCARGNNKWWATGGLVAK